jgi:dihydropyrimidine dehydrogenase (NAD+) subunit PreA
MADLSVRFAGITSPNPFWLASGPPTNTAGQVMRAFDAGWGGAVWKTIGEPIVNTSSRYGAIDLNGVKMMGFTNIELISDRSFEVNFRELYETKKRYPKNLVIASLMVESRRESWHEMVRRAQDAGADALELNFGCPHGMSERGMGSAVGQVPEYTEMITTWVKEAARIPVIVKLTPNVTDVTQIAAAAERGGADAVSLINTVNSLIGVNLETLTPLPNVGGKSSHGGYCGPAIKPIALHLLSCVAKKVRIPISGIGGIGYWNDAAEHIAVGASTVQVCTAAMHYGFRIVEDMVDGLSQYMDDHGYRRIDDFRGRAVPNVQDWGSRFELQDRRRDPFRFVYRLPALLRGLRRRGASVYRAETGWEWKEKRERHGCSRAAHHGGRMRGVQSVRARLPGRKLHHDEGGRYGAHADELE